MAAAYYVNDDILIEIFKRLPEKSLLRFKCVQKSWYRLIKSPHLISIHSEHQKIKQAIMFMFVPLHGDLQGRVLYRIDYSLNGLLYNSNSTHLNHLLPLLVFPQHRVSCIKFGSKIYFLRLDYYFSDNYIPYFGRTNVYTIEEKDLMCIEPSEDNTITNFKHLFTKTKRPMHSPKITPVCFVANNKLYVLSCSCFAGTPFEVFSPVDETWRVLPSPYDVDYILKNWNREGLSHLVSETEQMVYVSTGDDIFSFNLETRKWTISATHVNSTFYPQATLVGEMTFGFLDKSGDKYVCASKPFSQGKKIMQPSLAPDRDLQKVLSSSRFRYVSKDYYSDYIVALQDYESKEVLCIVTCGSKTNKTGFPDTTTSYITLSIFGTPGDFFTSKNRTGIDTSYADEKAGDGGEIKRCFKANFRYTKHFIVSNSYLYSARNNMKCFL